MIQFHTLSADCTCPADHIFIYRCKVETSSGMEGTHTLFTSTRLGVGDFIIRVACQKDQDFASAVIVRLGHDGHPQVTGAVSCHGTSWNFEKESMLDPVLWHRSHVVGSSYQLVDIDDAGRALTTEAWDVDVMVSLDCRAIVNCLQDLHWTSEVAAKSNPARDFFAPLETWAELYTADPKREAGRPKTPKRDSGDWPQFVLTGSSFDLADL